MSIATVVTRGYGSFGSVNLVTTRGYSIGLLVIPDQPGLEYTMDQNRLHYTMPDNRLHYTCDIDRAHYTIEQENE